MYRQTSNNSGDILETLEAKQAQKYYLDVLVGLEEIGINRTLHFVKIASHRIVKGMEPGRVVDRGHGASLQ